MRPNVSLRETLIAIRVYNEAATIAPVATGIGDAVPEADIRVIDGQSEDGTPQP